MVRHDSITSVPETPPAAMPDQVENIKQLSSDDEHEVKQKVMKQKAKLTHVWVTKVKVIRQLHCVRQVTLSHLIRQWGQPKYMEHKVFFLVQETYWTMAKMYQWNLYWSRIILRIIEQLLFDSSLMVSGTSLAMLCLNYWMKFTLQSLCTR